MSGEMERILKEEKIKLISIKKNIQTLRFFIFVVILALVILIILKVIDFVFQKPSNKSKKSLKGENYEKNYKLIHSLLNEIKIMKNMKDPVLSLIHCSYAMNYLKLIYKDYDIQELKNKLNFDYEKIFNEVSYYHNNYMIILQKNNKTNENDDVFKNIPFFISEK